MKTEPALKRIETLIKTYAAKKVNIEPEDLKVDFHIDLLDSGGVRFTAEEMESSTQLVTFGSLAEAVDEALAQAVEL